MFWTNFTKLLYFLAYVFIVAFIGGVLYVGLAIVFPGKLDTNDQNPYIPPLDLSDGIDDGHVPTRRWSASEPDFDRAKLQGCVADGLLSGYNEPELDIPLIQGSNCYYFHRALETWLEPPDFPLAIKTIEQIGREDVIYGMFIAEAIDTKAEYEHRALGREFDFKEMCDKKTRNDWGEHTCVPSLDEEEYRAYLRQITRDAMDIGIRSFLFGQINKQEDSYRFPKVDNVMREMHEYAQQKGITIMIGAQTGDITNKKYLDLFDYIDGGFGVREDLVIEAGPCFSEYLRDYNWCWPMMWHPDYRDRANDVFVYFDWNGQRDDDMHRFASLSDDKRHKLLRDAYSYMNARDVAFFPPVITPLPLDGDTNCHGPRKKFYSPHMDHECADMDVINDIISR